MIVKYKMEEAGEETGGSERHSWDVYPENVHSLLQQDTFGSFHSESVKWSTLSRSGDLNLDACRQHPKMCPVLGHNGTQVPFRYPIQTALSKYLLSSSACKALHVLGIDPLSRSRV